MRPHRPRRRALPSWATSRYWGDMKESNFLLCGHNATFFLWTNISNLLNKRITYCKFRLAQLGRVGIPSIVLVFIGLLLIGCLTKHLESDSANNHEGNPMKNKMKRIITNTANQMLSQLSYSPKLTNSSFVFGARCRARTYSFYFVGVALSQLS